MLGHHDIMDKPRDTYDFGTSADFVEKYRIRSKGNPSLFARLGTNQKGTFIAYILLSMFSPRCLAKKRS